MPVTLVSMLVNIVAQLGCVLYEERETESGQGVRCIVTMNIIIDPWISCDLLNFGREKNHENFEN